MYKYVKASDTDVKLDILNRASESLAELIDYLQDNVDSPSESEMAFLDASYPVLKAITDMERDM